MKILVCDDDPSRGREVDEHLRSAGQEASRLLTGGELNSELQSLFARIRSRFLRATNDNQRSWEFGDYEHIASLFDEADILLLDNNLTLLENDGPPLTAESIAGYLRAFTKAGYIVSLNVNPDVDFDLRYLVGDFLTRADLAINARHLENRCLWTGDPLDAADGFCPWYWPRLIDAADYRVRQTEFVRQRYGMSVLASLGFDDEAIQMLSRHAQGTLSPSASADVRSSSEGRPLAEISFRDFFMAKSRALPVKDERGQLDSVCADNEAVQHVIARIVAADVDFWLRRDVVGPQEPLVDAPHLTSRLPFLLGDRANDVDAWNEVARSREAPFGWDSSVYRDIPSSSRFVNESVWMQRPCFWWPKLSNDENLNAQLVAARGKNWADVVFCEDTSRFAYVNGTEDSAAPVEFVTESEGVWNRRYVAKLEGFQYAPFTRLAL
jgi:hypothetical protein